MTEPLTPRQIAELVYCEHSPLMTMSPEEAVDTIERLIKECVESKPKEA